jgi:hypothetical protein
MLHITFTYVICMKVCIFVVTVTVDCFITVTSFLILECCTVSGTIRGTLSMLFRLVSITVKKGEDQLCFRLTPLSVVILEKLVVTQPITLTEQIIFHFL